MTAAPIATDRVIHWRGGRYLCRLVTPQTETARQPVLVLSGGLQNRLSWARLERSLGTQHTLLIPDLPQANPSERPQARLTWKDLTDAALEAPTQLGFEHFAALGVSSGYPIAYRLAQQHPDRVSDLLVFGASLQPGPGLTALLQEGLQRQAASSLRRDEEPGPVTTSTEGTRPRLRHQESVEKLVNLLTNQEAARHTFTIRAAARVLRNQLADSPLDPLVAYVADRGHLLLDSPLPQGGIDQVRTLVGVGEHDNVTTVEDNRSVASTIRDATFVIMKHTDHLMHMERDSDFAELITRFLHQHPLSVADTHSVRL
ncbi:alpha/beta fold hydrolase [Streptomyces sp. NPDC093093]|uniref:alpha/beta fold hydrolase n=1 Tax=Streptomyces sp. NPDC093093 TaxID=3366025 RepID=UPI003817AE95